MNEEGAAQGAGRWDSAVHAIDRLLLCDRPRIMPLDGLRAAAITLVLLRHVFDRTLADVAVPPPMATLMMSPLASDQYTLAASIASAVGRSCVENRVVTAPPSSGARNTPPAFAASPELVQNTVVELMAMYSGPSWSAAMTQVEPEQLVSGTGESRPMSELHAAADARRKNPITLTWG